MVKIINDAVSAAIPREELMDAAKKFLLHSGSRQDVVLGDNIASPQFGSSDLLFVNHGKTHVTIARLNDAEATEKFIILSMSYYAWLKQFVTVGEMFVNGKIGMDMYLFSHDFSASICNLMHFLGTESKIHLIKYAVLQVDGLEEPAVYFQPLALEEFVQGEPVEKDGEQEEALPKEEKETSDALEISAEELSEFNRLEERYLR